VHASALRVPHADATEGRRVFTDALLMVSGGAPATGALFEFLRDVNAIPSGGHQSDAVRVRTPSRWLD
jgi:hypothetical protein